MDDARDINLVEYLKTLGCEPVKIRNHDYWYISPLRDERTASFKVNNNINRWYDHGLGTGGNIIDFAILYHRCSVSDLLQQLGSDFSFHQPRLIQSIERLQEVPEPKIIIISNQSITSFSLLRYLHQRRIPLDIAERFCYETKYGLNDKTYFGIGFKNDAGGYEIRNPYFKTSSSPKDITTIDKNAGEVKIFEGFFDFLSFIAIHQKQDVSPFDFVILNSVSFFEKARPFIEKHQIISLYLDRDSTGQNYTEYALSLDERYRDESMLYSQYKDLNDWLQNFGKAQKQKSKLKL